MIDTTYPLLSMTLSRAMQEQGQVVLVLEYVVAQGRELKTDEELKEATRTLALRMPFDKAAQFGSEIWRAAQQLGGAAAQ